MNDNETIMKIQRLEKLKNEVLVKYLDDIDVDQEMDLYDKLIEHFTSGDLDDIYENSELKDMSIEDKKKVLEVIHKYQNVVFYDKNPEYWIDSIDGIPVTDYNLITYQLLDNFDLLIRLYLKAGEESLKILNDFDKYEGYERSLSTIETIKRSFVNDEVLIEVFSKLTDFYDIFTDNEVRTLINYAEGTLYYYEDSDIKITNPLDLGKDIYSRMNTNPINESNDLKEVFHNFFLNEDGVHDAVEDMYYDYQEKLVFKNTENYIQKKI